MKGKRVRLLLAVATLVALVWGGVVLRQHQRGFANAMELAQFGLWTNARDEMARYLRLHPDDAQARFMMSEFWVNDDQLTIREIAPRALAQLRKIPDDSPLAAEARTQQGKLQFLLLHKPVTAERLLREAIALDERNIKAYQLLSTVLEMTGRYYQTEPLFWRIFDLSPPEERSLRLRKWYMSQFFPLTANNELDERMGFEEAATAALPTEAVRYLRFRETEPDEPLARAALARWTRRAGQPNEALGLLDIEDDSLENEMRDPVFVATLIDLFIDLGEYQRAEEHFKRWPGSEQGFDYWRLRAMILEEVQGDFDSALEAYDEALATWPGQADWRLMHRKAGCLARAGKRDEAVALRKRADTVEQLMEDEVHTRLRYILGFLDNPDYLLEVADFYRKLDRPRETRAWTQAAAMVVADTLE